MYYTESHEWINGETGVVGITRHAVDELGEIVFVELPKVGDRLEAGAEACILESTKAAVDIYAPVGGVISAVNQKLVDDPSLLVRDPEQAGWLFQMTLHDHAPLSKLLDLQEYRSLIEAP